MTSAVRNAGKGDETMFNAENGDETMPTPENGDETMPDLEKGDEMMPNDPVVDLPASPPCCPPALEYHPFAALFPLMPEDSDGFLELVEDIREHGLREPITLYQNKVLDGRNRRRACHVAGVAPVFESYPGDDPLDYVISKNLRRRHLSTSQRAMVAAKLATMRQGERTDLEPSANLQK